MSLETFSPKAERLCIARRLPPRRASNRRVSARGFGGVFGTACRDGEWAQLGRPVAAAGECQAPASERV